MRAVHSIELVMVLVIAFAASAAAAADDDGRRNRAPRLEVEKQRNGVVGAEIFMSLRADDADGDVVVFAVEGLPAGARFEGRTGDLLWTPGAADVGSHLVTFSATDGTLTSYASTRFTISAAPTLALLDFGGETLTLLALSPWRYDIVTNLDPRDDLVVTVDGLPPAAMLAGRTLQWTPTDDDLGDHAIVIHLKTTDGLFVDEKRVLHVRPNEESWESYALPGLNYAGWVPLNAREIGVASGPSFEVVVAQYVHRNDNVGPSHGRISLKADLLFPSAAPNDVVLVYSASLALSLERNPQRSFLLPIFAVDVGGLHQKQIGDVFQVTPQLGLHLWQSRNIFVTASAGYLLALPQTERLHGPRFSLGGNFTFW